MLPADLDLIHVSWLGNSFGLVSLKQNQVLLQVVFGHVITIYSAVLRVDIDDDDFEVLGKVLTPT